MGWGSWDFSDPNSQKLGAPSGFLQTGQLSTSPEGTHCRSSNECASGYACSGGKCVPVNGTTPSTDGTLSGCGDGGGGTCNSLTTNNVTYGGGTASSGFHWNPVYSADGCTISGCKLTACGGENGSDCPGGRYCRYSGSSVQCQCGDPPPSACSPFCDTYSASTGETAGGCQGLICDECEVCSSTLGKCIPSGGSNPCHCDPDSLPECYKCNDQGTLEPDTNCKECYTTNVDCGCGEPFQKTCCYTKEELKNGLTGFNRCAESVNCDEYCDRPDIEPDPCVAPCGDVITICGTTCPSLPAPPANGFNNPVGQIEVPGQCCVLYQVCDLSNLPDECDQCECNCDSDCNSGQTCNSTTCQCE